MAVSPSVRPTLNGLPSTHVFEPVAIVRQTRPAAPTFCWDCGGPLGPALAKDVGFVCEICSTRWRTRWVPCPWWERLLFQLLPTGWRWHRYRLERA
ncbi:MAG: hypothetical protein GEV06_26020 [Luteitalea sp.]|nr:hypothetical protein [Luteitalea sp.]